MPDVDHAGIPYDKNAYVVTGDAFYVTVQNQPILFQVYFGKDGKPQYLYSRLFAATPTGAPPPPGDAGASADAGADSGGDAGVGDGAAPQGFRIGIDRARLLRLVRETRPSAFMMPPHVRWAR
jgi:hypothetical protein